MMEKTWSIGRNLVYSYKRALEPLIHNDNRNMCVSILPPYNPEFSVYGLLLAFY